MGENRKDITLNINNSNIVLSIYGESTNGSTILEKTDAFEFGEALFQLQEGYFYEYKITNGFSLESSEVVSQSKVNRSSGRISPNIYVGTLTLNILNSFEEKCGEVQLEVQSVKTNYREDYRRMLEEITDKCTDLMLQHSSPISQNIIVDFNADAETLYQRFAFIKSVIDSDEFTESVHKIISSPVTKWKESETQKDIRGVRRINNSTIRQIAIVTNRIDLPDNHPLKPVIKSIPSKIRITFKSETVDTPENRFVKHALTYFLSFIRDFRLKLNKKSRLNKEALLLEDRLEQYLSHSVFKEILKPTTLPLNSPVLQRKEGYREILRVWLMFDLAAKLVWKGGDDVYKGDKRDVAVLYEYWLFFKLLDIVKEVFRINPAEVKELIKETNDGLGLQLKQGKYIPLKGVYYNNNRKLNVEFSYNKTFSGEKEYPEGGSWTRNLRPDYTLSVWPYGIEQEQAESEELIVHIHFDAKYKIEHLYLGNTENLDEEKEEQNKGTYKRADLLKMHTYRDAIRRTAGAYVVYPGSQTIRKQGFHEIVPGLGAFSVNPSKQNDGTEELKKFLNEVVLHFLNRASQREKMSFETFDIHKDKNTSKVNEALPEAFGKNRNLLPDNTFVLVAYYKNEDHLRWIINNKLYNARAGTAGGSLRLGPKETGAKYLLLHTAGETKTRKLFKITKTGPKVLSKQDLINKSYINPGHDFYLVYNVSDDIEIEFKTMIWDIKKLKDYKTYRQSPLPFAVSLSELMISSLL